MVNPLTALFAHGLAACVAVSTPAPLPVSKPAMQSTTTKPATPTTKPVVQSAAKPTAKTTQPTGKMELSRTKAARARIIGEHIWQRECGGRVEGLTSWNEGEEFASLGIGHFIWYPANCKAPFGQTFPDFLVFAKAHGQPLPRWLDQTADRSLNKSLDKTTDKALACPWNSREEFQSCLNSHKMRELRAFLLETIPLQALFICQRLEGAIERMQAGLSPADKRHLQQQYARLAQTVQGLEALTDYLHFKGEGSATLEQYHGQGWGLKQVLLAMRDSKVASTTAPATAQTATQASATSNSALQEFVRAAKEVLERRVRYSPPERHEQRWLKGWHKRLDGYLSL